MFQSIISSVSFPKLEEKIAQFWKDRGIYEKSLAIRSGGKPFVFYEGPPTANGLPHPGHCLTRAIKDLFPRYKTMRGYDCQRKAGWDTHGLPVEVEVCKELGIHSKEEIEAYGIEPFIRKCVESVFRYTQQWEQLTERLGFWIHLDEAYVTFHQSYVESVWWALKNLFDRGLLYQGYKIVWWWAQGGTALSSGEVGQGYREVADPSVFVRFPLIMGEEHGARGENKLKASLPLQQLPNDKGTKVDDTLIDHGYSTGEDHTRDIAEQHGLDYVNLSDVVIPPLIVKLVPENVARENVVIPLSEGDGKLTVIVSDPEDYETIEKLRFILNRPIEIALAPRYAIIEAINRYYSQTMGENADSMLQEFTDTEINFIEIMEESALGEGLSEGLTDVDLLVWTTTPWTLPSNQFAAVKPELQYAMVSVKGETRKLIMAEALVETIAAKVGKELTIISTMPGEKLIGSRYMPPFDYYYKKQGENQGKLLSGGKQHHSWRVVPAEFVTVDTGTGIVHQAPAFGEVDFDLLQDEQARFVHGEGPPLICSVAPDGTFTAETPEYQGRWVKDCDRDIIRQLKAEGKLFHQEQYLHDYPFCWRAEEDPLIQYPRRSWFISTTKFKEAMLANNSLINWLPEHIRDGRFGNFLESNVDWALSRERYWGTPLPIWVCEKTGYKEAVASYEELLAKPGLTGTEVWEKAKKENPDLPDDLMVHKPYIDAVTYDSPKAPGARMRRVSEVIDCWFDSGAMPFAQWGYPHQPGSEERFKSQFPADFISEALDQTRGWFYSLLAISTLLFGKDRGQSPFSPEEKEDSDSSRKEKMGPVPLASAPPSPPAPLPKGEGSKDASPLSPSPFPLPPSSVPWPLASSPWPLASSPWPLASSPSPLDYPHPFRNCIVLGLMLGEDGGKMSKSKRNYREPNEIFNRYGADALRWYFYSNQPPWTSIRYSEQAIKDCIPEFLLRLWNVYSFFVIYASIDKFDPAASINGGAGQLTADVLAKSKDYRPIKERAELDRWILSELNRTIAATTECMDAYDNFAACGFLSEFVDALSNWYVRRSRDRFWSGEQSADKADAYWTLYECLLTTCKLIAPFVPFLAEEMWQNLAVAAFCGAGVSPAQAAGTAAPQAVVESVHLCDYPVANSSALDKLLSQRMALVREIVSLGRSARMGAKLKVRQPLSLVEVVLANAAHQSWLEQHDSLICDELNVKRIEFAAKADHYINYTIMPDLKRLGPRLGKRLPALRKSLAEADGGKLLAELESHGHVTITLPDAQVMLDAEDIQVRLQAKPGWAAAQGRLCVVVLATQLTPELIAEGLARELVRVIQDRRKEMNCEFTDRIVVGLLADSEELTETVKQFRQYIQGETLAVEIGFAPLPGAEAVEVKVGDYRAMLSVKKA